MPKIWPFSGNDNNYGNNNRRCCKKIRNYVFLIISIGALAGCCYLVVKWAQEDEADSIPYTFQVDFLEVTSMTFSRPNNSITSNQYFNLTVNTKNAQLFRPLKVTIEYDHHLISNTTIAPFHQDVVSVITIPVQMGTADTRLPDKVIDSIISTKLASDGVLDFKIKFRGDSWQADYSGGTEYSCHLKMVCKGVAVTFSSTNNTWSGFTKDGPFPCKYSSSNCS